MNTTIRDGVGAGGLFAQDSTKLRLGELLTSQGLITPAQLDSALVQQRKTGRRLGQVLCDLNISNEAAIAQAVAVQMNIPFTEITANAVSMEARGALTETQARRYRALPLTRRQGRARVAFVDPTDWAVQDELARILGCEIDAEVVCDSAFLITLDRIYTRSDEISGLALELGKELVLGDASSVDFGSLGQQVGAEDAPVVRLLQTLFEEAVRARASDVHVEPMAQRLHIRLRIDGELHLYADMEPRLGPALALRLKLVAGLDISEKRLPQDGRFCAQIRQTPVDIRISTMPNQFGESVVMRVLQRDARLAALDGLHLPELGLAHLRAALSSGAGLVVVTGPTGSGKTTTLYSALGSIDAEHQKIITVEDPVEYRLPGINQVQVNERIGLSFGNVLRSALRQDPDVVLLGEMRDHDTAETGLRAALTGHLVLSTLHTNDALSTPARLVDMGVPSYMVAMALQLVVAQRLLRLVCVHCAGPHTPSPQEAHWLASKLGDQWDRSRLQRGRGCGQCRGTGFLGRRGIYEVLPMTEPLVAALHNADNQKFSQLARLELAQETLAHQAARLAALGHSLASDAMRIGLRSLE